MAGSKVVLTEGGFGDRRGWNGDERFADSSRGGVLHDILGACGGSRVDFHDSRDEGIGDRGGDNDGESTLGDTNWLEVGILYAPVFIRTWATVMGWNPVVAVLELPLWEFPWGCDGGDRATDVLAVDDRGNEGCG